MTFSEKKIPGSDFLLAESFFLLLIWSKHRFNAFYKLNLHCIFLFFVDFVFLNAVEGGLKDVDHDYLAGAKTLATIMRVKVKEGRLTVTKKNS